jgi:hypothetical protein
MNIILYSISEDEAGKKLQRPIERPVQGEIRSNPFWRTLNNEKRTLQGSKGKMLIGTIGECPCNS